MGSQVLVVGFLVWVQDHAFLQDQLSLTVKPIRDGLPVSARKKMNTEGLERFRQERCQHKSAVTPRGATEMHVYFPVTGCLVRN